VSGADRLSDPLKRRAQEAPKAERERPDQGYLWQSETGALITGHGGAHGLRGPAPVGATTRTCRCRSQGYRRPRPFPAYGA
jgi:hypothetical protein